MSLPFYIYRHNEFNESRTPFFFLNLQKHLPRNVFEPKKERAV